MQLLYFGWVRTRIGIGSEEFALPGDVGTVGALLSALQARGENYAEALEEVDAIRVAVNQELADLETPVADSDEIAVFPPMTGG